MDRSSVRRVLWPVVRDVLLTVIAILLVSWIGNALFPSWVERTADRPHGVVHTYQSLKLGLIVIAASAAFTVIGVLRQRRHWLHLILVCLVLSFGIFVWMIIGPVQTRGHGGTGDLRFWLIPFFVVTMAIGLLISTLIRRFWRRPDAD